MTWLESEPANKPADPPPLRGAAARRETLQVRAEWLEQDEPQASDRKSKRPPAKKGPPPLPETPKPKKAQPPPIPREERATDPPRARRSTKPPRGPKGR
jgi:hypothetical protein